MSELEKGLSRRRVLVGTAWAAPAILVAVSAPARAASGDVVTGSLLIFNNVSIFPENGGNIGGNFSYRISWVDGVPADATLDTHWTVTAVRDSDQTTYTMASTDPGQTDPVTLVNAGSSDTYAIELSGVQPGTYTVTVRVTADPYVDTSTGTTYLVPDLTSVTTGVEVV